jgi:hypothetical protein
VILGQLIREGVMAMRAAQTRRFRGKNKAPKWTKPEDGIVSVMVLPLAVTDPADLARLEKLFGAMWLIKRAVQRDAARRGRCLLGR